MKYPSNKANTNSMKTALLAVIILILSFTQTNAQSFDPAQTDPFGLSDIGDRSAPTFADLDNDSDLDMLAGNGMGQFIYAENIGTTSIPVFSVPLTNPFGLTDIGGTSIPTFVDLDNDGDLDLMAGAQGGSFFYFENTGDVNAPTFAVAQFNPFGLSDIGSNPSPTFVDLDNDGDLDLMTGEVNGHFFYFENTGDVNAPTFAVAQANPFGLPDIGNYSSPTFADLDNDGDLDLLSGNSDGFFTYCENTGDVNAPSFAAAQTNPFGLTDVGGTSIPTFVDLDNDGDMDLMAGKNNGKFSYFENTSIQLPSYATVQTNPFSLSDIGDRSTPSLVDLDNDGDLDVMAGTAIGDFKYFENVGTALAANFAAVVTNPFSLTNAGVNANVSFVDLDDDGDLDIMAGSNGGKFKYYENTGTVTAPVFAAQVLDPFSLPDIGIRSFPSFADIDNDNDFDLVSGKSSGAFEYFENTGSASMPSFAAAASNPLADFPDDSKPFLMDVDNDGDFDILAGAPSGFFYYYENTGNTRTPVFAAFQSGPFKLTDVGSESNVSLGDLDDDGDLDLISGASTGAFKYFENILDSTKPVPDVASLPNLTDPISVTPSTPTATDAVDGTLNGVAYIAFPITELGTTEVVWTFTDAAGNTTYQTQNVTITAIFWQGGTSTAWSTATNWVGGVVPTFNEDVIIVAGAANDPEITTNRVVNSIEIQTGATLTITSNRLTSNTVTTLDGSLIIASGAIFKPLGAVSGSGSATVHRNTTFGVSDGQYSVMGSPITTGSTSSLGSIVYSYDETVAYDPGGTDGSTRFASVSTPETMSVGDGYFSANTGSISFTGMPNSGDISIAMVYDEANDGGSATHAGFNLVSNPYTAALNYDRFIAENSHIDGTIYLWDDGGSDVGARSNSDYVSANSMGAASGGSSRAGSWDGKIRSTQGFFVKATSADLLNFTPIMMNNGGNTDAGFFRKAAPTVLRFSLSSSEQFNEILVGFTEEATTGFDRSLDAYKVKGNSDLQLYSKMGEANLAIQALPLLSEELAVSLGFDVAEAGHYTFALSDPSTYEFSVYLMDHQLNKLIDLSEGAYAFESAAVTNSERFSLVFSQSILSTEDELGSNVLMVFSKNNLLHIRIEQELIDAQVNIYSLNGTLIKQLDHVDFTGQDIQTHISGTGIYIMTVQNSDQLFIKKFINN